MKVNYGENFASRNKVYVLRRDLKRDCRLESCTLLL